MQLRKHIMQFKSDQLRAITFRNQSARPQGYTEYSHICPNDHFIN